jgi:hypothetical protein
VERAADLSAGPGGVPELLRRSGVAPDGQFDAEAVAAWEGALYVGLKEPLATGAALLLRIDGAESAFDAGRLREGRLSISARLGLGFPDDKGTSILQGISDMTFAGDGMLYFAANAPDERFSGGGGAIWRVPIPTATPAVRAPEACTRFAKVAPEGLCPTPDGRTLMVVFDRDREVPMWMTWPLPRPSPSPSPSPSGTPPT